MFRLAAILLSLVLAAPALAHDSWISNGAFRNANGEWCCGDGDCGMIDTASDPNAVRATPDGYEVHGFVSIGAPTAGAFKERVDELVPYSQAQPSPDGAYWRCRRRDGSRRCFFAPPPNS